jgi:hypothetical protein
MVCLLVRVQHTMVFSMHGYPTPLPYLIRGSSTLVHSHLTDSHFCRYVQMDNTGSTSADVKSWTLANCLEEGGFPALLWDTLKDFGYTTYPEYSTREVKTTGQLLRCEVKVKISEWPANPTGKSGSVGHKGETCPTQCRRLLSKHSQLSVESTSQLCSQSNSGTWATHCPWWRTRNYPSSPGQLSL